MKNLFFGILFFLVGFGGVLGYRYYQVQSAPPPEIMREASQSAKFSLEPPSEAVEGVLTVTKGKTLLFARTASEFAEASSGAKILLGESVATKNNSAATVEIPGLVTATFDEGAEVVFANLFPTNMVLQQKSGKVFYDVTDTEHPVSVRALHTLVSINSGETIINMIDTDVSITVKSGSVKFAIVDTDNNTRVYELEEGKRANIDDPNRKVFLLPGKIK